MQAVDPNLRILVNYYDGSSFRDCIAVSPASHDAGTAKDKALDLQK